VVAVPPCGLLAGLASEALALGRGEDAERILLTHLNQLLEDVGAGNEPSSEISERAAEYAVKLATATGKGPWVDYVFDLYSKLRRPCAVRIVDELHVAMRKVKQVNLGALRDYVA